MGQRKRNEACCRRSEKFFLTKGGFDVYVSPTGDDSNSGDINSPVQTIEKARDIIRQARVGGELNGGATIYLRGGDYEVEDTITFTSVDSGSELYPLTIKAYNNESVRITGGTDIEARALASASSDITSQIIDEAARANIKAVNLYEAGITDLGEISRRGHQISENKTAQAEVSVDGNRLRLAGWPNEGFVGLGDIVSAGTRKNPSVGDEGVNITKGCSFTYTGYDRPEKWARPENAWLSGVLGPNFAYDYYPLQSVDGETDTITLREGAVVKYYSKQFFRFENILEELDTPGEYYIDRDTGMLYIYMPQGSTNASKITVSALDKDMIKITDAKNIRFEGIEFDGGRKSGIVTSGTCSGISVDGCKVHFFGDSGISLRGCTYSSVKNSEVYDLGKNGIFVSGGNYKDVVSGSNVIYNNSIYRFAQLERSYYSGVYIGYQSVGTKVSNNHIYDAPHAGIIFYGVNNEISYNEINDVVNEFHDMDAIYVNNYDMPWERGNTIKYNYFHDIGGNNFVGEHQMNVAAIRTDNNGHGLIITNNVFYNIGDGATNNVSGVQAQGTHNRIEENIFIDCKEAYCGWTKYNPDAAYDTDTDSRKSKMDSYVAGVYGTLFPELKNFWNEHPANSKTNVYKNNLVVNIKVPMSATDYPDGSVNKTEGYRGASETIISAGNHVTGEDIGFRDYANGDIQLLRSSEAFTQIPELDYINMSLIGRK